MTPPPRLRETSASFSRVLAALRDEEPDPELVAKVLALPDRSPRPSPGASGRGPSLVRWLVVGTTTLALMGIGWKLHEDRRPPPNAAMTAATTTAKAENASPPARQPEMGSSVSVDDLPTAPVPPSIEPPARAVPPARAPGAAAPSDSASTFHEELALVEAARAGLARGDGQGCLRTLDRYDARFRGGVLTAEADITRIEAWSSLGERAKARALADRFLAQNAASPYAPRVHAVRAKLGDADMRTQEHE